MGSPELSVTDASDIHSLNATTLVNISMNYENENDGVFSYTLYYLPLLWTSELYVSQHALNHSEDTLNLIQEKKKFLMNCSLTEQPQSTGHLFNHYIELCYNSTYVFAATACNDQEFCGRGGIVYFKTPEHTPTCPPHNLTLKSTGSKSLKASFLMLDWFCLHGEIVNYKLLLFESNHFETLPNPSAMNATQLEALADFTAAVLTNEYEFTGLEENWNYTLLAFAENGIGYGLVSERQQAVTDEDGKFMLCLYAYVV